MPLPEYILFVFFFFSFLQKTKLLLWSFFQVVNISYGAAISFLSDSPTFKGASLEEANQSPSSGKDAHRQPAKDTHVGFCVRRSYIKSFCRCDCTGCFFRSRLQNQSLLRDSSPILDGERHFPPSTTPWLWDVSPSLLCCHSHRLLAQRASISYGNWYFSTLLQKKCLPIAREPKFSLEPKYLPTCCSSDMYQDNFPSS